MSIIGELSIFVADRHINQLVCKRPTQIVRNASSKGN